MGTKIRESRKRTLRRIRATGIGDCERETLAKAVYECSPYHKKNPHDFGIVPTPRPDKTLCDEAGIIDKKTAEELFTIGRNRGLISEASASSGFPKQIWVVDAAGRVFEAMHGGSREECYHGYPVRRSDPFFQEVIDVWCNHEGT